VAKKYGIRFSRPGNGICHQVHLERFGVPGMTLIGSDSHTPTGGGIGMLAMGAGGLDVAVAMGGGAYYITMPKMIKVNLTGKLRPWVSAKDVSLEILRLLSVKGGVGYILERNYGLNLPPKMREAMGYATKDASDVLNKELQPEEIFALFVQKFENVKSPLQVPEVHYRKQGSTFSAEVHSIYKGEDLVAFAQGNGSLNAVSNALKTAYGLDYSVVTYSEHALEKSSSSRAIAYVGIESKRDGKLYWGAGVDADITHASIDALVTAINNSLNA
jgi:hypothetical protein